MDITKSSLESLSSKFRKEKYGDQLLGNADWAVRMFVRYVIAKKGLNTQGYVDNVSLARIEKEMMSR